MRPSGRRPWHIFTRKSQEIGDYTGHKRIQGALGVPTPPCPRRFFFTITQFSCNFKRKPLFWAILGSRPPSGLKTPLPPNQNPFSTPGGAAVPAWFKFTHVKTRTFQTKTAIFHLHLAKRSASFPKSTSRRNPQKKADSCRVLKGAR